MKLVSVSEMKAIEKAADAAGFTYQQMMENAGDGLFRHVVNSYGEYKDGLVFALIGSGNNGGDGLVALEHLALNGWEVVAYLVLPRPANDPLLARVKKAGCKIIDGAKDTNRDLLNEYLFDCAILIDSVLGTGAKLPLRQPVANILSVVEITLPTMGIPPVVVAVDCPSGMDCQTGKVAYETIKADSTVIMGAIKQGMLAFPAYEYLGKMQVVDLELPENLPEWRKSHRYVIASPDAVQPWMSVRPLDAHKGTFGTALVVAGSLNYTGAARLAGEAAARSGVGLVTLAVPFPLHSALAGSIPDITWLLLPHEMGVISASAADVVLKHLERVSTMLIGPGWGTEDTTLEFLERLLGNEKRGHSAIGFIHNSEDPEASQENRLPAVVVDADGLKLLAKISNWPARLPAKSILTPHPGEMAVLTGLTVEQIQSDRIAVAEKYAHEWGHVVVLKGAFTVIAEPDGETAIIPVASSALAHAGTGDVLAGLIAGLRAQEDMDPYGAALCGAWIHGQAGVLAAEMMGNTASVLASDVLEAVQDVLSTLL